MDRRDLLAIGETARIGGGCLSTTIGPIYDPEDRHAAEGPGARRWPAGLREGVD